MQNRIRQRQAEEGEQESSRERVVLPLENEALTPAVLFQYTPPVYHRKRAWDRPAIGFLSYLSGQLALQVTWRSFAYRLTIAVTTDHLMVGCSCGKEEQGLCLHAFKALQSMVLCRGEKVFERYVPGREVDIACRHPELFRTHWSFYCLKVMPKRDLGTVYLPDENRPAPRTGARCYPDTAPAVTLSRQVICYFIIESKRKERLPVLIPCTGQLTKNGDSIKRLDPFFSGTKKENDALLTEDQRVLNLLCFQIWQAAEELPGDIPDQETMLMSAKLCSFFGLWKQAFSFLHCQKWVCRYPVWRQRELRGQPEKKRMKPVRPCTGYPAPAFHLRKGKYFYQLTGTARHPQGRLLHPFDSSLPFFLLQKEKLYFLENLQDAAVVHWMHRQKNKLTVFPEQYPAFEKAVLKWLGKWYEIKGGRKQGPGSREPMNGIDLSGINALV